jgi:hypothetical protein
MAVYFAQAWLAGANQCGPVKIGFSADPLARLAALSVASEGPIYFIRLLDGGKPEERRVHHALRHLLARGEVFRYSSEMLTNDFGLADYLLPRLPAFAFWIDDAPPMREWRKLVRRMIDHGPLRERGFAGGPRTPEPGQFIRTLRSTRTKSRNCNPDKVSGF